MTDTDFVENYREFSTDSSMVLINYSIDLGAFGYGQSETALLKISDTNKNLTEFSLPNTMINVKWIDNQTISAQYDIFPYLRTGEKFKDAIQSMNGIKIKITPFDNIDKDDRLKIEHREISPNGKYELVAYRYSKNNDDLNIVHISVISVGMKIPKYGNYFIGDSHSDYVFYGTWTKDNRLKFYTNSIAQDMVQYFFVQNGPDIPYTIITDDNTYGDDYRWVKYLKTKHLGNLARKNSSSN